MNRPSTVEQLLAATGDQFQEVAGFENMGCADCVDCLRWGGRWLFPGNGLSGRTAIYKVRVWMEEEP